MKSVRTLFITLLLATLVWIGGCSSGTVYPVVSRDSKVSRDKALIVMGVSYWEMYNDTQEDDKMKKLFSADLIKDEKRVKKMLDKKSGTALDEPLHYLSRFRFQFRTPNDDMHQFVRFNTDTREYESIAIHEFTPGPVQLVKIATDQFRFKRAEYTRGDDAHWQKYMVPYEERFGAWELEQGKVTYMGHLTLYFKTERFVFGLLMPKELVAETKLVAIVIEDRFEETRKQLQAEKPWFPIAEMENQSQPGKWVYLEDAYEAFTEASHSDAKEDKRKKIKRDIKKYFF